MRSAWTRLWSMPFAVQHQVPMVQKEQTVDFPVPHIMEEVVTAIQSVPHVRIQERILEEIFDVCVPRLMVGIMDVVKLNPQPQEWVQNRATEQSVDAPSPQIQEQSVDDAKVILPERLQQRMVGQEGRCVNVSECDGSRGSCNHKSVCRTTLNLSR